MNLEETQYELETIVWLREAVRRTYMVDSDNEKYRRTSAKIDEIENELLEKLELFMMVT